MAFFGISVLRKERKTYAPTSQPYDYINIFLFTLLRRKSIFIYQETLLGIVQRMFKFKKKPKLSPNSLEGKK